MKKSLMILIAAIIFFSLSVDSKATSIDGVLNNAKKEGKAVMLELGSVGCIPCEQMKPVMEKLRTNYRGKLEVLFVDVSRDREAARRFHVFAIPTQVFLDKSGEEFHRHMGFYGYEEIVPVLKKAGL
jgi:thioredoxin 1